MSQNPQAKALKALCMVIMGELMPLKSRSPLDSSPFREV